MLLKDFIKQLQSLKEELQDKEIFIEAPNGLLLDPVIKFDKVFPHALDLTALHVKKIVITAD